jgi:predicted TIM-barrel enzyme
MSLLARLREKAAAGRPIVGAVAGAAGADFWVARSSARFANPLAAMLPLGDANALALGIGREALGPAKGVPVLVGLCGGDPMRAVDRLLAEVKEAGFAGVQNFPTVGLIDGVFRRSLEETECGYAREVEMIRAASRLGLFTAPLVFSPEEAAAMAAAGADVLVAHPGLSGAGRVEEVVASAPKGALVLVHEPAKAKGAQGVFRA